MSRVSALADAIEGNTAMGSLSELEADLIVAALRLAEAEHKRNSRARWGPDELHDWIARFDAYGAARERYEGEEK